MIVELGNNDGANPASYRAAINTVMSELVAVDHVVWYTMSPFASWVPAANAELRAALERWPNLQLADWGAVSAQTPGALYNDGLHLRAPGAEAFAKLLFTALNFDTAVPVIGSFSESAPIFASGPAEREPPVGIASNADNTRLWFVTRDGRVTPRAGTPTFGSLASPPAAPVVGIAATRTGQGYWLIASDGSIFTFGDAHSYGSGTGLNGAGQARFIGMSPTPSGAGYWLVASDGGIFTFGDATFYGSTGALRLNEPIVAMSPTPSGAGYWLVASDGGIFAFGDANVLWQYRRAATERTHRRDEPDAVRRRLLARRVRRRHLHVRRCTVLRVRRCIPLLHRRALHRHRAVFERVRARRLHRRDRDMTFCRRGALFVCALGITATLVAPVLFPSAASASVAPEAPPGGMWLLGADGAVFALAGAPFEGSLAGVQLNAPVVSLAATPSGRGYWIVTSDGGIFTFGDATFYGSTGALRLNQAHRRDEPDALRRRLLARRVRRRHLRLR